MQLMDLVNVKKHSKIMWKFPVIFFDTKPIQQQINMSNVMKHGNKIIWMHDTRTALILYMMQVPNGRELCLNFALITKKIWVNQSTTPISFKTIIKS